MVDLLRAVLIELGLLPLQRNRPSPSEPFVQEIGDQRREAENPKHGSRRPLPQADLAELTHLSNFKISFSQGKVTKPFGATAQ
jgi:hypothetical protein